MKPTPHSFQGNSDYCERIDCERPRNHRVHSEQVLVDDVVATLRGGLAAIAGLPEYQPIAHETMRKKLTRDERVEIEKAIDTAERLFGFEDYWPVSSEALQRFKQNLDGILEHIPHYVTLSTTDYNGQTISSETWTVGAEDASRWLLALIARQEGPTRFVTVAGSAEELQSLIKSGLIELCFDSDGIPFGYQATPSGIMLARELKEVEATKGMTESSFARPCSV